jgi:hypothetical protein
MHVMLDLQKSDYIFIDVSTKIEANLIIQNNFVLNIIHFFAHLFWQ